MLTPTNLFFTTAVVLLLFGSKKLRNIGEDLGIAFKNFREALQDKPSDIPSESKPAKIDNEK